MTTSESLVLYVFFGLVFLPFSLLRHDIDGSSGFTFLLAGMGEGSWERRGGRLRKDGRESFEEHHPYGKFEGSGQIEFSLRVKMRCLNLQ